MSVSFEELDYCPTPIGALSLRRRRDLKLDVDVFEVRLGDESLMTSLFTASEIALARLGLAALDGDAPFDVVVGGLGLGYTANAVLESADAGSLIVVDALQPVIEWHEKGLLPLGAVLTEDARCRLVHGDFFALDEGSESFYRPEGLRRLARHLRPGGVFGLWSDALPDDVFLARLKSVFAEAWAEPVTFHNPLQDKPFTQTVYLARNEGPVS
jgi:spermidine synthase